MIIETELVKRFLARIDEEDARSVETMAGGMLQNFGEYRYSAGYRKALADAKTLISETLEDLMKE